MHLPLKICAVAQILITGFKICAVAQIFTPTPAQKCPYNLDYFNAVRPEARLGHSFERQLVHLLCEQHQQENQLAQEFAALVDDQLRRNLDLTFDQFCQTNPVVEFSNRYLKVSLLSYNNQTLARESWTSRARSVFVLQKIELIVQQQIVHNNQYIDWLVEEEQLSKKRLFARCMITGHVLPGIGPLVVYPVCQAEYYLMNGSFDNTHGNPLGFLDFLILCCVAFYFASIHDEPEDKPLPTH